MTSAISLLATSTLACSRESSTIVLTVLIPLIEAAALALVESLVRTSASTLSESCKAAVNAALLFALTSEPFSSINISADIYRTPI